MTAVSDETGRELEPTYLEAAKRLLIGAIAGSCTCNTKSPELVWHMPHCRYVTLTYALENVEYALENVENALSASPVAQEPVAWVEFTEAGLIRFWTSDPARAEAERARRSLTKFSLSELIALAGRPRTPPATPAGLGADEIARADDILTEAMGWHPSENGPSHDKTRAKLRAELLALLSRGSGDQTKPQKDGSR